MCRKTSVMETIFSKVLVPQNGLSHGCLPTCFRNTILWILPNIEQKRIPLNDNIVWYKNSRVIKDSSNSGSFFLSNVPKYSGTKHFYTFHEQTWLIFWKIPLTKKIHETEKLLFKVVLSQFLRATSCLCELEGEERLKYRRVCPPHAEKFKLVSNDHGRMQKCDFFLLNWKDPFWIGSKN